MALNGVNPIDPVNTDTRTTAQTTPALAGLGEDAFLQLLLAELQNQDPLKPMEDKDFIAQLAQFNSLNQLTQMNETLQKLISAQTLAQGSSLIGKMVSGPGNNGSPVSGIVSGLRITGDKVILELEGQSLPLDKVESVQGIDGSGNNGGQTQSITGPGSGSIP